MGIVLKQSFKNTITIYIAFAIGGVNALFLYTAFLQDEFYGLVTYLLSTANILMPFMAFGVQYTILKFFSSYATKKEKDVFLSSIIFWPLIVAIPIAIIGNYFYTAIASYLSVENPIIKDYTFVIYLVALATAYFEIFYTWAKVQMQSVFGNVLKELFSRLAAMILLFAVYLEWITAAEFIYYLTGAYFIRVLLMALYALQLYRPKFSLEMPRNVGEIVKYSLYIILAGSAGTILLDIDKFMIPQKEAIAMTAYYAVGVYIGSVVETPGRAMAQIMQPMVSKALNNKDLNLVSELYRKSSINLFLVSGLVFLLINTNIKELYHLLPEEYSGGVWVVFFISLAKLYHMLLGANGAIISTSKYYKILLPYGIAMAVSVYVLNDILIDKMSIDGAAISTFIVVLVFNSLKLLYVKRKFKLLPFSSKTRNLSLLICFFFATFYFWDFSFHPILNILLKSSLVGILYIIVIYKLKISTEINQVLLKVIKK
ncbi:lipopolysaccharide biosynthesis protein [Flavicella sediminum]|uniref:lipopolysaccharide biosynthesis protein n=1 Tax=Flavicella sediminum TaxID=2585141 RepID=UPI001120AF70|nr:polysaccharide biosynthesis C-terminal domain-containing protein [Flavicella sediminum]